MAAPVSHVEAVRHRRVPGRYAAVVSPSRAAIRLSAAVAVLSAVASLVGLLWNGGTAPATFVSVHGQTVELFGSGLYRYDSLLKGAGNQGSDMFALIVGIPVLLYTTGRYRRASTRGTLVLAGVLLWFAYLYLTLSVSTAFNEMFLVYCALVAASSTALVLTIRSVDTTALSDRLTAEFPARAAANFLVAAGGITLVLWGGITLVPLLQNEAPGHLGHATTTVTPALDLGLVIPAFVLAAVAVRRGSAGVACLFAFPLLVFVATLAPLIPTQTLSQLYAGVEFTPGELVGLIASWVVLGLVALVIARRILLSIDETQSSPVRR